MASSHRPSTQLLVGAVHPILLVLRVCIKQPCGVAGNCARYELIGMGNRRFRDRQHRQYKQKGLLLICGADSGPIVKLLRSGEAGHQAYG